MLLPVKSTSIGKSRIRLDPMRRARLARAMALDTARAAAAATGVRRVLALVEDAADGHALGRIPGVAARRCTASGLNEAIREACAMADVAPGPVAVLPADLPSLRAEELDAALSAAAAVPLAVVPDRQGTGTTMLAARVAALLDPHFGPGSFAAHRDGGAVALAVPAASGLRRDVDVLADLRGVTGPLTRAEAGDLTLVAAAG